MPPKSVVPASPIAVRRVADALDRDVDKQPPRAGHTAVTFPTLCAQCNNDELGAIHDPALARFANAFSTWIRGALDLYLTLPHVATVEYQPALVARAVIGHLLAAEPDRELRREPLNDAFTVAMRRYFLSDAIALPAQFRLYVWSHPFSETVIARDIQYLDTRSGDPVTAHTLKFYPLAFALVSVERNMPRIDAVQIAPVGIDVVGESAEIEIPLRRSPGRTWPEQPQHSGLVLLNRDRAITVSSSRHRAF